MFISIFYVIDLLNAAKSNQLDRMVKQLNHKNVNTCDESGVLLLMWSETGALVDLHDHESETALYKAACNGLIEICKMLVKNNANVNQPENKGQSRLWVAAQNGHMHCMHI